MPPQIVADAPKPWGSRDQCTRGRVSLVGWRALMLILPLRGAGPELQPLSEVWVLHDTVPELRFAEAAQHPGLRRESPVWLSEYLLIPP